MASKRKALSVDEKVRVIRAIQKGEKKSDVGRRFELSHSTVATIWKNKETILQAAPERKSRKKLKKPKFEELDRAMLSWFNNQRQNNVPISGPIVKAKAAKFAEQLGVIGFKASEGWLGKFKQRHKITCGKMREARDVLPRKFQRQNHGLSPERKDCKRRKHLDTIEEAPGEDPPPAKQSIRHKISGTQESGQLLQENTKIAETIVKAVQELDELDPLINDENNEEAVTTTTKVKQEFEDNETEVPQEHFDTELEEEKDTSVISLEQFLKGCEFYLTPELADYVKTQIKQPK